ncbi:hypothetical protein KR009_011692, partial [Drosophila setifemur]
MTKFQILDAQMEVPPRKVASGYFLAGGAAGFLEIVCFHPLDVVKSRMQLQGLGSIHGQLSYSGIYDTVVKIYRVEGITSLYKGIVPPMCIETPKRGAKFMVYELIKPYFYFGAPQPTPLTHAVSGAVAGTLESFVTNPFEVVKITQQAHRGKPLKTFSVANQIIQTQGFRGLYRGLTSLLVRNAVFHFAFFGTFHSIKDRVSDAEDPVLRWLGKTVLAAFSCCVSCALSVAFDMAKSRIQGPQPVKGEIKYRGLIQTLRITCREEGFRALLKGLGPMMIRAGPGGAMILVAYEYFFELIVVAI